MTVNLRQWLLVGLAALSLALAGCASGDNGNTAAKAPAAPVAPSTVLTAQITGASINGSGQPVVTFTVMQNGAPFPGLMKSQLEFAIAKLNPTASGNASWWQSYIVQTVSSKTTAGTVIQATTENTGNLTYSNGVYTYVYNTAISPSQTNPAAGTNFGAGASTVGGTVVPGNYWQTVDLSYQAGYTTRVGLAISGTNRVTGAALSPANATMDFVPNGGAGSGTRYIVKTDSCNQCHNQLEVHGGTRDDVKLCPICHNPGNMDVAGTTLDFKQFIHRAHFGSGLPSVVGLPVANIVPGQAAPVAGVAYGVYDASGTLKNFSMSHFPQMIASKALLLPGLAGTTLGANGCSNCSTNNPPTASYYPTCEKCHVESASGATTDAQGNTVTDAANWRHAPTQEACTSCHDNIEYTSGSPAGGQIAHAGGTAAGYAIGVAPVNTLCAGCHSDAPAPVNAMHGYANNMLAAAATFQFNILSATLNTATNVLTATVSVKNPATGAYYDIQQDTRFCRAGGWDATNGTCFNSAGSLTLGVAMGAAEHTNGGNGSIITPASVITLNLLNPKNYLAPPLNSSGGYSAPVPNWATGDVPAGPPTPPAVLGTVVGSACGTSTVTNCTFLATLTLPASAVAAIQSTGSFTLAMYGAASVNYVANTSLTVLPYTMLGGTFTNSSNQTASAATASGTTSNTCGTNLYNGPATGSPATIGTPAPNLAAGAACITATAPVAAVTADFAAPYGGCSGGCTALTPSTGGRRIVVTTDSAAANGNTSGSCNNCHGMVRAHGGTRAGNAQLCIICHNPNNSDLDQRPQGYAGATTTGGSVALDGLREHTVDFKVLIHGLHAGATTQSMTGLAFGSAKSYSNTTTYAQNAMTPLNAVQLNGQMRQIGMVIYGNGGSVNDFSGIGFPGHLDNCTNCHAAGTFTLPLRLEVLPTTVTSVAGAANQWEATGHSMTIPIASTGTTVVGFYPTGNQIVMQGANYTNNTGFPVVVTAYGASTGAAGQAAAGTPANLASWITSPVWTPGTLYCVVNSTPAPSKSTMGYFQLTPYPACNPAAPVTISSGTVAGTFAIGPANLNVAAQGYVWSATASVCTACHDSPSAADHILRTDTAWFSPWPSGAAILQGGTFPQGANGVTEYYYPAQPYSPTPLTKGQWASNVAAGYRPGVETCVACHGPGGIADVSAVHRIGQ